MFNLVPEQEQNLYGARILEYQLLLSGNESESAERPNVSVPETRVRLPNHPRIRFDTKTQLDSHRVLLSQDHGGSC